MGTWLWFALMLVSVFIPGAVFLTGALLCPFQSDAYVASWFRAAAANVLVKLHESYPIASVDVEPTFHDR